MTMSSMRAPMLAIHCSGADASQWTTFAQEVHADFNVVGVNLYGTAASGHWPSDCAFTMEMEAVPILQRIDASRRPVHLVGHSYGGAVALHVAMRRPGRVASLMLYEPSAFHVLKQLGPLGQASRSEIETLARCTADGIASGDRATAARTFMDYWNGSGSWDRLKDKAKAAILAWIQKAPLDFQAALEERTLLHAYRRLACPVLILRGERALTPSRLIAEALADSMLTARLAVCAGAGHMGPFTHASDVNAAFAEFARAVEASPAMAHAA